MILLALSPIVACADADGTEELEDTAAEDDAFAEDMDDEDPSGEWEDDSTAPSDGGETRPSPTGALELDRDTGSICGSNDMLDVENASTDVQRMADAVGQLEITVGSSTFSTCSGALVSENVFLTAGHCFDVADVNKQTGSNFTSMNALCGAMQVRFNFQLSGGVPTPVASQPTFACSQILDQRDGNGHDYALIQLTGSPGTQFGFLDADLNRPIEDDPLMVIHHPAGAPKMVSFDQARNVTDRKIAHKADTLGGSSGAPIIMDGRVVGVHTTGGCNFTGIGSNSGFPPDRTRLDSQWLSTTDYFDQLEDDAREDGDGFGGAVALGDINGDKIDDIVVSAPEDGSGLASNVGRVSFRMGSTRGLNPRTHHGFEQPGVATQSNSFFGEALALGDFNGDGFDDIAVGTPRFDFAGADTGSIDIVYGAFFGPNFGNTDHFIQSTFIGFQSAGANLGAALAVGDFDGDGFEDLAVGAPGEGLDGAVYILYGSTFGLQPNNSQHFEQVDLGTDQSTGGEFGAALGAGDFDGDGRDDLLIGSPFESVGGVSSAGYVTLIPGSAGGLDPSDATGFAQSIGTGSEPGDRFGEVIAVGDFDGDSFADAAFGLPRENKGSTTDAGYIIVHEGTPNGLVPQRGFSRSSLDGSFAAYDYLGESLTAVDLDGDGREELVIGVPGDDGGQLNSGTLFVLPGTASGLNPAAADELDIRAVGFKTLFDNVGRSASLAGGDVDGDGDDDLAAAIANQSTRNEIAAGAVMVLDVD